MNIKTIKNELQNILSGESKVSHGTLIQTITLYLRTGIGTGTTFEGNESNKEQETKRLIEYINKHLFGTAILILTYLFRLVQNNAFL
jgi:hypothetical protein